MALIVLIAVFIATLAAINRRPAASIITTLQAVIPPPDGLPTELRRCNALGPQDAEDPHCQAVWEENRRRFFGRPARPLPPPTAAPAISPAGDAR